MVVKIVHAETASWCFLQETRDNIREKPDPGTTGGWEKASLLMGHTVYIGGKFGLPGGVLQSGVVKIKGQQYLFVVHCAM
jgi:hypothetical protein